MKEFFRSLRRNLSKLILSLILAFAVWISSVTASDPTEVRIYPNPVPIEFIGQDPALIRVNPAPDQISLTMSAPLSIWNRMINELVSVRAVVDLSGLPAGKYVLPVQIQVAIRPIEIISLNPDNITVEMAPLASREMPIQLVQQGEPAIGYLVETSQISDKAALLSGPENLVNKVQEIRAVVNLNRTTENIERLINLQAFDASGGVVDGISITPPQVKVLLPVTQRGGYRNVVVKVVLNGQISTGYRVTNISVYPPAVTVFSSDPQLVSNLPGYVDTEPLNLTGANDDLDERLSLDLPAGVLVVGEQTVSVQVGIAAIEGSLTLNGLKVDVLGLEDGYKAEISPTDVDIFLSGPIPVLDALNRQNVRILLDLKGLTPGTYQRVPVVETGDPAITVESLIPGSVEVTITGTAKK